MNNSERITVHCVPRADLRFKPGDRVIFCKNSNKYNIERNNPLFGTEYFCKGTVLTGVGDCVRWDNGTENFYESEDLDFAAHYSDLDGRILDPNLIFKLSRKVKHGRP
jgi:hypothetical protein